MREPGLEEAEVVLEGVGIRPLRDELGAVAAAGKAATVTVLGLLQKVGATKLPGGLDVLDNWWIIGIAGGLYIIEFFADKIPSSPDFGVPGSAKPRLRKTRTPHLARQPPGVAQSR